ncbi:TonB-dependent receptor [Phenylobacterium montanum]|uniref:TonB-dependent receptor n=1 Tax=Phenylobacterium montanum TaxID=2823693 RepID=A0A975IUU6_9CAUL|nr:TonB-dependent receptor [Caulobacter sp. S6]QUD87884.1 TonB-dependent receptor [Caulobacter sp. S6]
MMLVSGVSAAALSRGAALAADAPAAKDANTVQEVVVTASRSGAQSLQKMSMAISAVNVDKIDKAGQQSLTDLAKYTPSLSITEGAPGFNKFDMRGLATGAYRTSDTSDRSLVAVYVDDTPISVQGQTPDLKVYDLERVEILRGPQGTLYGAGSMAGTVRFITAKPNTHQTFGTLEVAGYDTEHGAGSYNLKGMINMPLIPDTLALRATVYQGEDGGYIDNIGLRNKKDANLARTLQARAALRWTPNDKFTADLAFTTEQSQAYGLNSAFTGLKPYTISTNSPEGTTDDFNLVQLNLDYDAGFANLVSSTAYTHRRIGFHLSDEPTIGYFFQDYTGLPVSSTTYPLYDQPASYNQQVTNSIPAEHYTIDNKVDDFMEEVRLVSKDDGPIKWNVGVFYERQTRNLYQDIPVPGFDTLSYMNYFYGPFSTPNGLYNSKTVDAAFNANDIFSGLQNESEHQVAIFTDDTWHVTRKLDLSAGVRWFDFSEKYYLFEGGVYGVINHVPLTENATQKANGFNPRVNVTYHVSDDFMAYAEAAKGFRYGGANQPVPIGSSGIALTCKNNLASYGYSSAPLNFGPDHLWSYSVGEKGKFADGRVTLNADAYWIDWSDVQTRLLLNCSYFFTDNKGKIQSRGVEAESTIRLTHELTLTASGSYNDSHADGNIPTVGAFDGNTTPYFPKWIASLILYYDRPLENGTLHAQLGYQYRGKEQTTFDPLATIYNATTGVLSPNGASKTFAIIPATNNLSASLAYDLGNYEFGVFGNNLTDGVKETDIGRATYYAIYQAGDRATMARPRTIGARFKVKF